jgi:hypothetical protein
MNLKYWKKTPFYLGKILAFTQQYPGAMFGLGSGIYTALHNQTTIFLMTLSVRGFRFHQINEITNAH